MRQTGQWKKYFPIMKAPALFFSDFLWLHWLQVSLSGCC